MCNVEDAESCTRPNPVEVPSRAVQVKGVSGVMFHVPRFVV